MITKNINHIAHSLETLLSETFEGVLPEAILSRGRRGLNFALDFLQPHVSSMGLRIAVLNRQNIEIVIPERERNLDIHGNIHQAVAVSAAMEASQLLWLYNQPDGTFTYQLKSLQVEYLQALAGSLRLRFVLSDIQRETCYAELARENKSEVQFQIQLFNQHSILIAKFDLVAALTRAPSIEWT